jgi:aspartate racemase
VVILATRGTLISGFYQRKLEAAGYPWRTPAGALQAEVDTAIRGVKEGTPALAAAALARAWRHLAEAGAGAALLACTELPVAAELVAPPTFPVLDSNLELARASIAHVLAAPWYRASRPSPRRRAR